MSAQAKLTDISPGVRLTRPPDPPGKLETYITVIDGKIIVDYGQVIRWVGLDAANAEKMGNELLAAARTARLLHLPSE